MTKVYKRTETGSTCGNRWMFSKLAGDVCAKDRGHRGTHQNTRAREAHTFSWFDNEGIPSEGVATLVDWRVGRDEINAGMMGETKKAVREMSAGRTDALIKYRDGRTVRLVLVDAPEEEAAEKLERTTDGRRRIVTVKGKRYVVSAVTPAQPRTPGAMSWIPEAYVSYWSERNGETFGATRFASASGKPGTIGRAIWDTVNR